MGNVDFRWTLGEDPNGVWKVGGVSWAKPSGMTLFQAFSVPVLLGGRLVLQLIGEARSGVLMTSKGTPANAGVAPDGLDSSGALRIGIIRLTRVVGSAAAQIASTSGLACVMLGAISRICSQVRSIFRLWSSKN